MDGATGHRCSLTETNTHSWIFVCECGELGTVQTRAGFAGDETIRAREITELVKDRARAQHRQHVEDVRNAIGAADNARLDAHAALVGKARSTLTRVGRWGSG